MADRRGLLVDPRPRAARPRRRGRARASPGGWRRSAGVTAPAPVHAGGIERARSGTARRATCSACSSACGARGRGLVDERRGCRPCAKSQSMPPRREAPTDLVDRRARMARRLHRGVDASARAAAPSTIRRCGPTRRSRTSRLDDDDAQRRVGVAQAPRRPQAGEPAADDGDVDVGVTVEAPPAGARSSPQVSCQSDSRRYSAAAVMERRRSDLEVGHHVLDAGVVVDGVRERSLP